MGQAMVRISDKTRQVLRDMAQSEEESMQSVLEKAVEEYRRRHFLEQVNRAYEHCGLILKPGLKRWRSSKSEGEIAKLG